MILGVKSLMMNNKKYTEVTHRWLEQLALPLVAIMFLICKEIVVLFNAGTPPTFKGYLTYLLEIVTFYLNLIWVAPLAFIQKRRFVFLLRLVLLIAVHHLLRSWLAYNAFSKTGFTAFVFSANRLMLTVWLLDRPLYLSFLIAVYRGLAKRKLERQQLKVDLANALAEKTRIESIMAQMQLSPHLLLGGLYHLQVNTKDKLPLVANATKLLADIVRYSLMDLRNVPKVPLCKEVQQVKNRISYQEFIYERPLCIQLRKNIDDRADSMLIPPGILITITDNVLKYGLLHDAASPATIQIKQSNGLLEFVTRNDKIGTKHQGQGIGLSNVRQVLDHYYPDSYSLAIKESDVEYSLRLSINT